MDECEGEHGRKNGRLSQQGKPNKICTRERLQAKALVTDRLFKAPPLRGSLVTRIPALNRDCLRAQRLRLIKHLAHITFVRRKMAQRTNANEARCTYEIMCGVDQYRLGKARDTMRWVRYLVTGSRCNDQHTVYLAVCMTDFAHDPSGPSCNILQSKEMEQKHERAIVCACLGFEVAS